MDKTLAPNQVKLSDGRIVTMRETKGNDEIAAAAMLGKHFTQDSAGISLYTKALVLRAIVDIDGNPVVEKGPIKFKDFQSFWNGLLTRDGNKLTKKYQEMNSDEVEEDNGPLGEDESGDLQALLDSEKP